MLCFMEYLSKISWDLVINNSPTSNSSQSPIFLYSFLQRRTMSALPLQLNQWCTCSLLMAIIMLALFPLNNSAVLAVWRHFSSSVSLKHASCKLDYFFPETILNSIMAYIMSTKLHILFPILNMCSVFIQIFKFLEKMKENNKTKQKIL